MEKLHTQPKVIAFSSSIDEEKQFLYTNFEFIGEPENGDVFVTENQIELLEEWLQQVREEDNKVIEELLTTLIHYIKKENYNLIIIYTF